MCVRHLRFSKYNVTLPLTRAKEAIKEKRTQVCILITREDEGGGS